MLGTPFDNMFLFLDILLNIGLDMLHSDSFMLYLDFLIWYSTDEF